jgi:signal transduction histidine kinase
MLNRLMPDRLSQWLMALVIGGIIMTQALALTIYHADRMRAVDQAESRQAAQCLAGFEQVLASETPERRRAIMHPLLFKPRPDSAEDDDSDPSALPAGTENPAPAKVATLPQSFMIHLPNVNGRDPQPSPVAEREALLRRVLVKGNLPDGTSVALDAPPVLGRLFTTEFAAYVGGVIAVALIGSIWAVTLATKPLRRLSEAADRFGADVNADPMPETGPSEVKHAAAAFNRMQRRLRQFILERTRMLAAISHDLRTPLTRMRLRAEMLDDDDQRDRMLNDLMEMEQMVGATLAFAREEAVDEATQRLDVKALLEMIRDDAGDMGQDVTLKPGDGILVPMRPRALKRAIVNIVENAVRYAGAVELSLERDGEEAVITIADHGPGIPAAERENVLRPFYRCEESRSRDTGGIGLGLSIAADAIASHGGQLALSETPGGGLTVEVRLPAV